MRHQDREINSVGEFIDALSKTTCDCMVWFRGQSNTAWTLLPNIARPIPGHPEGRMSQELPAIKRFKQNASSFLARLPRDDWEWIFLMQHHRGLTRLLDWTESPLVALYFALANSNGDSDGVVWCLDPVALNRKAGHHRKFERDILAFGIDAALENYLPERLGEGHGAVLQPVAAIGPRNSARMIAQSGTFTIMHSQRTAVDDVTGQDHVWRLLIPMKEKDRLRRELRLLGFNEFMLFPELETLALQTQEMFQ